MASWKRPTRRVLAPVYLNGLVGTAATAAGVLLGPQPWPREIPLDVYKITVVLLPLMFLAGLLRTHLGRTLVGDLLAELRRPLPIADVRDLLARTLGDPALRIVHQDAQTGALVDSAGDTVPDDAFSGCSTTPIERDGRAVAALVHDSGLDEDPHVLGAITAALGLALENDRLATEVRAQLDRVRESRARIVAAGDEARRRLERDLHDGAQQQLVTAALTLQLATQRFGGQLDPDATKLVGYAAEMLDDALAELRRFARGVHPAVLTEAGLVVALRGPGRAAAHDGAASTADGSAAAARPADRGGRLLRGLRGGHQYVETRQGRAPAGERGTGRGRALAAGRGVRRRSRRRRPGSRHRADRAAR